jgi:hypothetical protein
MFLSTSMCIEAAGICWNARRTWNKKHAFFRVCPADFLMNHTICLLRLHYAHSFQCVLLQMLLPRAIEFELGLLQAVIVL